MGELIKGHDMSGPDFATKQGCEFISVNDIGGKDIHYGSDAGKKVGCTLIGNVKSAVVDAKVLPNTEHVGQLLEDEAG
eukprot:738782-Pelagomonas_calceolata.AAC.1